jgi:2,3-bisphosphoglycerate-dependent phosphoglycerate mutase
MELYFIRHGQSANNAGWHNPNYQESPDPELTTIGQQQASHLAAYFAQRPFQTPLLAWNNQNQHGFGFTHLYTSLMVRAINTALPTARSLGLPITAWTTIHEEGGIFSRDENTQLDGLAGKPRSYFEHHFPELGLPAQLDETGWWNRSFESEDERQPRANLFLKELLDRHGDREGRPEARVVLFSHGGFFNRLVCAMLNLPWRQASHELRSWFLLNNGSISRFDIQNNDLTISYMNRTDHLPPELIT